MFDKYYTAYYFDEYVSGNFLGQLDQNSTHPTLKTCDNSNGILFLAMAILMMHKLNILPDVKAQVDASIKRLQVIGEPGLFMRELGDGRMDSHDNMIGIIILSVIFDLQYHHDIHERGKYKFKLNKYLGFDQYFNYNNQIPGKFDLISQRQGGDIAVYQLADKKLVNPLYLLWFTGGLLIAAYKKNPSSINLGYFRLEIMKISCDQSKMGKVVKPIIKAIEFSFQVMLVCRRYSIRQSFENYFKTPHPMHEFLRQLSIKK